jgi:hypothetical protein
MNSRDLITYWKKVKETIHLFDKIIVQYVVQWSAVLLAMIGASVLAFSASNLAAGVISITAILVSFPIAVKCFFYYELLEEALRLGLEIEKLIFKGEENKFGLTHRLCKISTRTYLEITFFGWTIFLPFVILAISSLTLSVFYLAVITTLRDIFLFLFSLLGSVALTILLIGFFLRFRNR